MLHRLVGQLSRWARAEHCCGGLVRAARRLALVATLSATAILLAGCQTPPEPDENAPGCAPENASLGVSAEGELFSRPEVSFDTPLRPLTTERLVLVEGDGRVAVPGSLVTVEFVAFNGATGEPVEASRSEEHMSEL